MRSEPTLEEDIAIHIFSVSSAMVGVCLTVIGLIRVVITLGKMDTIADDLLAIDALLFLVASLLSYWALRTRSKRRLHTVERTADAIFIVAMTLMTAVCGIVAYAMSSGAK
jgi:membrane protein implicated in regulation of membrane protease activity